MAKITLGKRPKSFKHVVKAAIPGDSAATLEVNYVYRTRIEFGAFVDELLAAAQVQLKSAAEEDVVFSLGKAMTETRDANANYIMAIVDGWGLDVEFNRENVVQMCDELPGIAMTLISDYRAACAEGRLGN